MFSLDKTNKKGLRILMAGLVFSGTAAFADETDPTLYQPFAKTPQQKELIVAGSLKGSCKKQSDTDKREDAWQCRAFGKTYDPCFKHPFSQNNELICPKSPWSNKAIKIVTHDQLDNSNHQELDMSKAYPWAIELTDGTHCLAKPSSDPIQHNYKCQNKQTLSGKLMRCNPSWKITRNDNNATDMVHVKRAWF